MKKKLMMMLGLLGMQSSIQALSVQEVQLYCAIVRHVVVQKIKSLNPFGKAVGLSEEDDFFDDMDLTPAPKKEYTFKKYSRKYNSFGQKISYKKKKK